MEFAFLSLREAFGLSGNGRGGRAVRTSAALEPNAVSAKVRAAHHAFLARCGLNAVHADS